MRQDVQPVDNTQGAREDALSEVHGTPPVRVVAQSRRGTRRRRRRRRRWRRRRRRRWGRMERWW